MSKNKKKKKAKKQALLQADQSRKKWQQIYRGTTLLLWLGMIIWLVIQLIGDDLIFTSVLWISIMGSFILIIPLGVLEWFVKITKEERLAVENQLK